MLQELIGRTLGQYQIVEKIGQGGMAAVFKARQQELERWVAVKVLPPQYADSPDFRERFLREARAIAQLEHPHILPVYDFGQQDEYTYLVMRYIEGARTLADMLRQPLSFDRALAYLDQIAAALDYAHQRGVIHRDVKPTNILLDGDWVFLADFGLARMMASAHLTSTQAGTGSPAYMSPEQGRGGQVDARTDVYSLGVIAYGMLTGQIPHLSERAEALIYRRIHEPPPSLRQVRPDISPAVEQQVQRAMATLPEHRFSSASAFVAALRRAVRESGTGQLLTMAGSHSGPPTSAGRPAAAARSGQQWMWWLAGLGLFLVAALLAAGITWLVFRSSNADQPATEVALAPTVTPETGFGSPGTATPELNSGNPTPAIATPTLVPWTATPSPLPPTATPVLPTPLPPTPNLVGQNCTAQPGPTFAGAWPDYRHMLGCPIDEQQTISTIAEERFEGGHMFWRRDTDQVYIIYDRLLTGETLGQGQWQLAPPQWKWDGSNPDGVGLAPPPNLVEPRRGFGWLWRTHLGGAEGPLGWALDREYGFDNTGQAQVFENGVMFKGSTDEVYILLNNGQFFTP